MRPGLVALVTLLALPCAACGGGSSPAPDQGDGGGTTPEASSGSGLFSDPSIPSCTQGVLATTQIVGTLAGQPVSLTEGGPSQLDANDYYSLASMGTGSMGVVWHPVDLTWQGTLAEEQAVTLTGGFLSSMPDNPQGPYYCITSGDFGPERLASDAAVGRVFRFRVTGARKGSVPAGGSPLNVDCSGATVAVALSGCIYRTKTLL